MSTLATPGDTFPAADYAAWLQELKQRIRETRVRSALAVNTQVLLLNWSIGREILERQEERGWGSKVVERVSNDLLEEFPGMKGFSPSNLRNMRAFAAAWPDPAVFQQAVGRLPWGHQIKLVDKLVAADQRLWYAQAAVEHGWSRDVLNHQIDSRLIERQGKALTNFNTTLPLEQSDLAQQLTKDPYVFDALELGPRLKERELENALVTQMQKFLLELGRGFAYLGRQYPLEVAGQSYFLDLLFYNTRLHAYVVIELKTDDFKPEYAGKMQFYLASVDALLKSDADNASIGLILCKTRNGVIAEYTLRDMTKPMGVAEYRLKLPDALAAALPTPESIQRVFSAKPTDATQ